MTVQRCGWCSDDPLYITYHDQEWGQTLLDENRLFEMLCLEGQQAGLAWITVLRKREAYREHFFQYSIESIASLTDQQLQLKLEDASLIRHRGKLNAIRENAQAWLKLQQQGINLVEWLWSFAQQPRLNNDVMDYRQAPAQTIESQKMSKALKQAGFKFVGPTICYAFMQAVGMVNDHENHCEFKTISPHLHKS
ncbi:DNA-3-methyladenine glycosylase I [Acinetobacter beijerinckii]|jgi:DNA-3-methyladenine glycosylase I|uniref:DNA-3-methyladenine glycosylase I n=1 Tax=Acinetobacter beijerinckii TaxID=262668 RepID=UPI00086AFFB2|nr:DNA-3-methyladenine glycosylase I [Acinetobacter beijerinckii]ODN54850.1 DNA-3-methyladenine glycosidase [Acinetobacter sp. 51m]